MAAANLRPHPENLLNADPRPRGAPDPPEAMVATYGRGSLPDSPSR